MGWFNPFAFIFGFLAVVTAEQADKGHVYAAVLFAFATLWALAEMVRFND